MIFWLNANRPPALARWIEAETKMICRTLKELGLRDASETKGKNSMGMPSKSEIAKMLKKLEGVEPTRVLPNNASKTDRLKQDLCKQFVIYLREKGITQKELAEELEMEPARLNEIIKYKIELYTVDRLLSYLEKLRPDLNVIVA